MASFLSVKKFVDICETLKLTAHVTLLPKDGTTVRPPGTPLPPLPAY